MDGSDAKRTDILYVITKSNWGGAQKYVFECASAARDRYSVGVALGGDGLLKSRLEEAGIPVHPVPAFERDISIAKEFAAAWQLYRIYRATMPRIVHLNSSKAGGLGALMAHIAGVPKVIFTSHGLTYEEDRPLWQKALIAVFTWLTFMLSDKVVFVSDANHASGSSLPLMGDKATRIRLGIRPVKTLSRPTARKKLEELIGMPHPPRGATWIGTIAELHPNKGLPYLIDAIRSLENRNVVCVIIGEGESRQGLAERIAAAGLSSTVFLAGAIDGASAYLSAFDIFALTSVKEGLPYAILEAGSAGLPVVASGLPGIREVVTDMESGVMVRPKRPSEIAGALELLVGDKARRAAYGAALRATVERDFSMDRMIGQTLELYEEVLSLEP